MPVLDIQQICDILPHRYPFLLVDRIVEQSEKRIVGIKNVTYNEPFFNGHFPNNPVMPGVLMVEAIAQVAGVLVLGPMPDRKRKLVFLAKIEDASFRRPVRPGDQLKIEVDLLHGRPTRARMKGVCSVDGEMAAEATVMCVLKDIGDGEPRP
ncbi:MAG: 3-hydroxyacyl-ACP dehydratase FabZ [Bryobacteraceae bacterium]